MAGPLGGATGGSDSGHHRSCRRRQWRAPLGVLLAGLAAATTKVVEDVNGTPWGVPVCPAVATIEVVEDVDGGPGGATSGSDSGHH
jgi:hypothetical protein